MRHTSWAALTCWVYEGVTYLEGFAVTGCGVCACRGYRVASVAAIAA